MATRDHPLHHRLSKAFAASLASRPATTIIDPMSEGIVTFRPAAVLIAITTGLVPGVLFIERPETMRVHPGQIAFPGGRLEPGEDAVTAARREAEEELGIAQASVAVIGIGDEYRTGTGFAVTPVLATVPADVGITPDPREVAGWFEAPLAHVLDAAHRQPGERMLHGKRHSFTRIVWEQKAIWGITAAILINLGERLEAGGWR